MRQSKVAAWLGIYAHANYGGKASSYVAYKADGNGKGQSLTTSTNSMKPPVVAAQVTKNVTMANLHCPVDTNGEPTTSPPAAALVPERQGLFPNSEEVLNHPSDTYPKELV